MTYLFTKPGCGKCDWVKSHVELEKRPDVQVLNLDGENPEALAMLAYFECVTLAEKKLPILVSDAGEVLTGAIEVRSFLDKVGG
ncbi:MAG: hypothetical protein FJ118_06190 [Deltaproteobacteria bacterium]|nr:hypothetical protein [Deltaproteobacteria bacterium]